jgi:hypothetical protein
MLAEAGFVRVTKLLALLDLNRHDHPPHVSHMYKVFLRCEIVGGSPATSHELMDVGFFGGNAIPELSLTRPRSHGCSSTTDDRTCLPTSIEAGPFLAFRYTSGV